MYIIMYTNALNIIFKMVFIREMGQNMGKTQIKKAELFIRLSIRNKTPGNLPDLAVVPGVFVWFSILLFHYSNV